jgi:hypothetical protein
MKAAKHGAGVLLSRDEVRALSFDDAIKTRAEAIENDRPLWDDQLKKFGVQQ